MARRIILFEEYKNLYNNNDYNDEIDNFMSNFKGDVVSPGSVSSSKVRSGKVKYTINNTVKGEFVIDASSSVIFNRFYTTNINKAAIDLSKLSTLPAFIKFNKVKGSFVWSNTNIENLIGFPKHVSLNFNIRANRIKNLAGFPVVMHHIDISHNRLDSLKGLPERVYGNFSCDNNPLETLKYSPSVIDGTFNCSKCPIGTLEHSPTTVGGEYACDHTGIKNLIGVPKYVHGLFSCEHNKLITMEGCPIIKERNKNADKIREFAEDGEIDDYIIYCNGNMLLSLEGISKTVNPLEIECFGNTIDSNTLVGGFIAYKETGSWDRYYIHLLEHDFMQIDSVETYDKNKEYHGFIQDQKDLILSKVTKEKLLDFINNDYTNAIKSLKSIWKKQWFVDHYGDFEDIALDKRISASKDLEDLGF